MNLTLYLYRSLKASLVKALVIKSRSTFQNFCPKMLLLLILMLKATVCNIWWHLVVKSLVPSAQNQRHSPKETKLLATILCSTTTSSVVLFCRCQS